MFIFKNALLQQMHHFISIFIYCFVFWAKTKADKLLQLLHFYVWEIMLNMHWFKFSEIKDAFKNMRI